MQNRRKNRVALASSWLLVCMVISGCATEKYKPQPLNIENTTAKTVAKDPLSENFKAFLLKQGYKESDLPFATWGLDELTQCALYFHPKLEVAKQQLALANIGIDTAGQRSSPTLNANLAHSNQKNGDIRPWAYGLSVEVPIETGNKTNLKVEQAQKLAAAASMDVADTAWQLRNQIAKDLIEYHQNVASIQLLQSELSTQNEIVSMLQKRIEKGLTSKTELSSAQLIQIKSQSLLNNELAQPTQLLNKLASDTGLTLEKFKQISLGRLDIDQMLHLQTSSLNDSFLNKQLQGAALLNRIDVRRAIENYAAAEAKIKLEIAKQTPDISLTPGIAFEFGDSIWSLGFSTLLNLLHKNPTQLNEAKQLREIEGAQFEALQTQIISDLNQTYANYVTSKQNLEQTEIQYDAQIQHMQKIQKQFESGLIDRLELKQASLNTIIASELVSNSKFELLKIANQLENVMQVPLNSSFIILNQ